MVVKAFLQKNWKAILLVVLSLAFIAKTQYDYAVLYKMYIDSSDRHKEELEALQDLFIESNAKKSRMMKEYEDKIDELEKNYQKKTVEIKEVTVAKRKVYRKKFKENPQEIIKAIEEKFGFIYVK